MRFLLVSFLILFAGAPADPPRTIEIVGTDDMKYSVTTIKARPGEPIRIKLVSKGTLPRVAMAHNVVVLKADTDVARFIADGAPFRITDFIPPTMKDAVIAKTPFAGPGQTVEVSFTAPPPVQIERLLVALRTTQR